MLQVQLSFGFDERPAQVLSIHERLEAFLGRPAPHVFLDPVSQLVLSFLGSLTYGEVSLRAYHRLKIHYRTWEDLRDAPLPDIQRLISGVNLEEKKAPQLKESLQIISRVNGALLLDNLYGLDVESALSWLMRLPGVGPKIGASTLNFSTLRKRALVIDTHHLRVVKRLGLVGAHASFQKAYDTMMPVLPIARAAQDLDDHHHLMKRLGQVICRPKRPICGQCPLKVTCPASALDRQQQSARHQ